MVGFGSLFEPDVGRAEVKDEPGSESIRSEREQELAKPVGERPPGYR